MSILAYFQLGNYILGTAIMGHAIRILWRSYCRVFLGQDVAV